MREFYCISRVSIELAQPTKSTASDKTKQNDSNNSARPGNITSHILTMWSPPSTITTNYGQKSVLCSHVTHGSISTAKEWNHEAAASLIIPGLAGIVAGVTLKTTPKLFRPGTRTTFSPYWTKMLVTTCSSAGSPPRRANLIRLTTRRLRPNTNLRNLMADGFGLSISTFNL